MRNEEIIIVKQLPIIEENLKKISEEIDKKVELAKSLACTEDSVKEVKKVRTEIGKQFKELETQRKQVKEKVMSPYNEFESIYKEYISNKFNEADKILKEKIDIVEDELKTQKKEEVKTYFEEYVKSKEICFVSFEQLNINITLTASLKSLKEEVKNNIDKIADDITLINIHKNADEILLEYMRTLNVSKAIQDVTIRHIELERLEEEKKAKEEQKLTDEVMLNKIDDCLKTPKIENNIEQENQKELLLIAFEYITDDKDDLKRIVEAIRSGKGEYRQLNKVGGHYE